MYNNRQVRKKQVHRKEKSLPFVKKMMMSTSNIMRQSISMHTDD